MILRVFREGDEEISLSHGKKPSKNIRWNSFRNFAPLLDANTDNNVLHIVAGSYYYKSFSFAMRPMFFCYILKCAAFQ
jgi:hypothetical protein